MRVTFSAAIAVIAASLFAVGCAGPERKLGRGITNMTEFTRGGELSRSIEQTSIFVGPEAGLSTGIIHGIDQSVKRTAYGFYEIVTFPFPNHPGKDYGPVLLPEHPVYADSYKPAMISDPVVGTDSDLGFPGGDVAPWMPFSRFHVFDN